MNNLSGALVGSIIGAAIGCGAWLGVGYATGYELGILAVLVGIAVGIGAAMGAKGRAGTAGGVIAALVTIVGIVAARYVLVQNTISRQIAEARAAFSEEIPGPDDAEYWTAFIADRIVREREDAGETIDWPWTDDDEEEPSLAAQYPADIWAQAQQKWSNIPNSQRDEFCAAATRSLLEGDDADAEDYRTVASIIGMLWVNLHPMALIIMGIAAAGAYRTAKHSHPKDEFEGGGNGAEMVRFDNSLPSPAVPPSPEGSGGGVVAPLPATASANATLPSLQGMGLGGGSGSSAAPSAPSAPASAVPPPKPVRTYMPAAFDESQLPPQFRTKPPAEQ